MGVLQFDGTDDRLRWTTLQSALGDITAGAYTMAILCRRDAGTANSRGITNMYSNTTTTEAGVSYLQTTGGANNNEVGCDISGVGFLHFIEAVFDNITDTSIITVSKGSGTVAPRLGYKFEPAGSWTHEDATSTLPDQVASTILDIGSWQSSEFVPAHIGLVGWWSGAMSDANKEALDDNWRTSDWWGSAHGQPVFLAQLNVAGASVVDMAGNASDLAVTGTTLDAAETLDDWNFDGEGGAPADPIPPHRAGRGAGW